MTFPLPSQRPSLHHVGQHVKQRQSAFELPATPLVEQQAAGSSPCEFFITCFGRFEVRRLGTPICLCANRKGQSLLRYLVTVSGHRATPDLLQAQLWPEDEAGEAQHKLHIAVSDARRCLDEGRHQPRQRSILWHDQTYMLNPALTFSTDVGEFLQLHHQGQQLDGNARVACYTRACQLYTGSFLPEELYADWSFLQRQQLARLYRSMCRALVEHWWQEENDDAAMAWADALLKEDSCDECAHQKLMQIAARQGNRYEVLRQYHLCVDALQRELGVQPAPETQHLLQQLVGTGTVSDDADSGVHVNTKRRTHQFRA